MNNKTFYWFAALFLISMSLRMIVVMGNDPIIAHDSGLYIQLSEIIDSGRMDMDNGARTPVYPIFLSFTGRDAEMTMLVQMGLGLIIASMFYSIVWQLTGIAPAAFIAGSFYGLNLSQVMFERAILTETLTTFWITGCALALVRCWRAIKDGKSGLPACILAGFLGAMAAFTRPAQLYLPFILPGLMILGYHLAPWKKRFLYAGMLFLPAVILLGGWSLYNYQRFNVFSPTTLSGYNLSNHSRNYIQLISPRYQYLEAAYQEVCSDLISENPGIRCSYLTASQGIQEKTGLSFAEISGELTDMSLDLFKRHPDLYVRSVAVSWIRFWNAPGPGYYTDWMWLDKFGDWITPATNFVWRTQKYFAVGVNFLFLTISLITTGVFVVKRKFPSLSTLDLLVTYALIIHASAVTQALVETISAARFSMPTQPLAGVVVLSALVSMGKRVEK